MACLEMVPKLAPFGSAGLVPVLNQCIISGQKKKERLRIYLQIRRICRFLGSGTCAAIRQLSYHATGNGLAASPKIGPAATPVDCQCFAGHVGEKS
jgi:hypothetical protein